MANPRMRQIHRVVYDWIPRRKASIAAMKKKRKEIRRFRILMSSGIFVLWIIACILEILIGSLPQELIEPGLLTPGMLGGLVSVLSCLTNHAKYSELAKKLEEVEAEYQSEVKEYKSIVTKLTRLKFVIDSEPCDTSKQPASTRYSATKATFRVLLVVFGSSIGYSGYFGSYFYSCSCYTFAMLDLYEGIKAGWEMVCRAREEILLERKIEVMKREANTLAITIAETRELEHPRFEFPFPV